MKYLKKIVVLLVILSFGQVGRGQIADYYTTGYHVKKYDTFLEDFTKENEPCYKSNTFKLLITTTKMRIEIEDSSNNGLNISMDSYVKDILIGADLPVDGGALFHKSFTGVLRKLIIDDAYLKTAIPKYQTLKFTGRMYAHNLNFDDFVADKVENGDVYLCFNYENGEREIMRTHLSQKTPNQIKSDELKNKIQNDLVEMQNQKNNQLKAQQEIKEEEERLLKAQKTQKNLQDFNNIINQLQTIYSK
jgi:hypothetical protein